MTETSPDGGRSPIAAAVAACILACGPKGDGWQATLQFGPDFIGFDGHFPGQPIVPGVCLIEAVARVCARRAGRPVRIAAVENVKFFRPVGPAQPVELQAAFRQRNGLEEVRAALSSAGSPVAEIVLRLAPAEAAP